MNTFIIAQVFGFLGMTLNVLSYQWKQQKSIIIMQLFGSLFFAINMFMLNAIMGGMINVIGVLRATVYSNKDKLKNIKKMNVLFICLYILSYLSVFIIFRKEATFFNILIEILPLIAMVATTIGFSKPKAVSVRKMTLISSPSWLIYNCINFSVGGILCELFSLLSAFAAMLRFDIKNNSKGEKLC